MTDPRTMPKAMTFIVRRVTQTARRGTACACPDPLDVRWDVENAAPVIVHRPPCPYAEQARTEERAASLEARSAIHCEGVVVPGRLPDAAHDALTDALRRVLERRHGRPVTVLREDQHAGGHRPATTVHPNGGQAGGQDAA
jgi:hypothetical protein